MNVRTAANQSKNVRDYRALDNILCVPVECFSQYADATVASATLAFLNNNKTKLMVAHPALLPQVPYILLIFTSLSVDKSMSNCM